MDSELTDLLESLRRGEIVRVASDFEAGVTADSSATGYLVLAAEKASHEAVARLLRLAGGTPALATTRDRLEQMRIVGAPYVDDDKGSSNSNSKANGHGVTGTSSATQLAQAATCLAAGNFAHAREGLNGFTVRCVNWGGVVNCQRVRRGGGRLGTPGRPRSSRHRVPPVAQRRDAPRPDRPR